MKAVLIRLDHLGDILLCTPLVRACAKAGISMDVVVPRTAAPILEHNPHINRVYEIEDICPAFPHPWQPLAGWLKIQGYDALILPQGRPRELLWASLRSGIPTRIAMWSGIWGRLTRHTCLRSHWVERPRHFAEIMLEIATALGVPRDGRLPEVFLTGDERKWAADQVTRRFHGRRVIGIHPGCAGNTCNLPSSEYGKLAGLLLNDETLALVVTGTQAEKHLTKNWPDSIWQSGRAWNAIGELSLRDLAALVNAMALYVVPSTGPLHIASALGIATLSPFCPSAPKSAAIWGNCGGNGMILEANPSTCLDQGDPVHGRCDFRGSLTAELLHEKAVSFLTGRNGNSMAQKM